MRFLFHHLYHSFAWTYDAVAAAVSIGRWKAWGCTVLPYLRGKSILEIGFGPGHLLVELNRSGFHTLGLDESPQMIRQARQNLAKNGLPGALSRAYAQFLPFASDSLDSVISTFPSEYIFDMRTLNEVQRVLKANGRFVLIPMAWIGGKSLPDRAAHFLFRITHQVEQSRESAREKVKAIFAEHGFRVAFFEVEIHHSIVLVVVAEKIHIAESSPPKN